MAVMASDLNDSLLGYVGDIQCVNVASIRALPADVRPSHKVDIIANWAMLPSVVCAFAAGAHRKELPTNRKRRSRRNFTNVTILIEH